MGDSNERPNLDDDLAQRLQRLKEHDQDPQMSKLDNKAIEERLAKLKGIDPSVYTAPPITVYHNQLINRKTETEQTDGLIHQLMDEVAIDKKTTFRRQSSDVEIEARLARLRGEKETAERQKPFTLMEIDSDPDSEEEKDNVIRQLMDENKLPRVPSDDLENASTCATKASSVSDDTIDDISVNDELPWCTICNEDASIRCHSCGGDLYCRECFNDFHDDSDLRKHKTAPFKSKSRSSL